MTVNIEATKAILVQERSRLELERHGITDVNSANTPSEESGELSDYGSHPGDQATITYLRERDLALVDTVGRMLHKVDRALEKIENGTYGKCDRCDELIGPPRLEAIPSATLCLTCQDIEDGI
ncbi:MAG: TraR/DksA C4-type zinc finger protein [Armatimonadota bacterium]